VSLNLINDAWIPVIYENGSRRVIAPWQVAEAGVLRPDWPRPDLNIACLELLIGLVALADPPADVEDWDARRSADPARLRERLAAFAPAFNLTGDGPLFLQELGGLEGAPNTPDMLFIDSAGANTAKNNADLMVHRDRYSALALPLAAMALFAFQAHAPSGGAGNRTSMRGGGPLVTLVDPGQGLWSLIWANVPDGGPGKPADLPWMRATRVSDKGLETAPPEGHVTGIEAFFGMPRRLRLVEAEGQVTGVIQRPWGSNYAGWKHPLTPYYRQKIADIWLPVHPRAGQFGYRHWLGILAEASEGTLRERAACLRKWRDRARFDGSTVIVAGWAMDNMKPRDFIWSVQPYLELEGDGAIMLEGMILAADQASLALRMALEPVLAGGEARECEREQFYSATEAGFGAGLAALKAGQAPQAVAHDWLAVLRRQAMGQFEALALPGLDQRETDIIARIIAAQRVLAGNFAGYGKYGRAIYEAMMMQTPASKKGKAA
jgi:CRISPR system Cascade subunit CasA